MSFLRTNRRGESKGSRKAQAFWAKAKQQYEAVFAEFAEASADESHSPDDILSELKPLQSKGWDVTEALLKESYRNGRTQAAGKRGDTAEHDAA